VFVDEGGVAGDHEQPADAGETGDEILRNTVGKVFLLRIVAHVHEGQHGEGGLIGEWQGPGFRRQSGRWRRGWCRGDEPVAASVQGLDITGAPRIVPKRFSKFLDAGDQGRVANRHAGPECTEQLLLADDLPGRSARKVSKASAFGVSRTSRVPDISPPCDSIRYRPNVRVRSNVIFSAVKANMGRP